MEQSAEAFLKHIEQAASGLLFPSESDYPLTPYRWPNTEEPSVEGLLRAEGKPADTSVEEITIDDLFEGVTAPPGYDGGDPQTPGSADDGDEERAAETARWQALVENLRGALADLRAYRAGDIDIDVYVLGRHASGEWLGLKTKVIET